MKKTEIKILKIIIICTAFLYGGFYDFTACLLTVSLGICLLWMEKREKGLLLYWNSAFLLAIVIVAGYLISVICAVDRGMAFTGVLKFLPLILFTLAFMQFTKEEREDILMAVPLAGTAITVLSLLAYIVPGVKEHFYMADRLGGTFQYSNTMVLYLLVGIVLVESRYKYIWKAAALIVIQLLGIMLTGSRSVFVLMALVLIYYAWKNKAFRSINLSALAMAVLAGAVYGLASGNFQNIGRFLTVSFESSTLIGRLLYWQDALPLVLRNPFGLGYMGYYYSQGEIQTEIIR